MENYKELIEKNSKIIKDDKWVQLKTIESKEDLINGYTYSHEIRCNGNIVAVLPYSYINGEYKFLARYEATPCWEFTIPVMSSLTGGVDSGHTPEFTAITELKEESGFIVNEDELISLGTSYSTKSSDSIYHLYAIKIDYSTKYIDPISETELEKHSSCCKWVTKEKIINDSKDPFLIVLMTRLLFKLKEI